MYEEPNAQLSADHRLENHHNGDQISASDWQRRCNYHENGGDWRRWRGNYCYDSHHGDAAGRNRDDLYVYSYRGTIDEMYMEFLKSLGVDGISWGQQL
jgi:hypothetical protein